MEREMEPGVRFGGSTPRPASPGRKEREVSPRFPQTLLIPVSSARRSQGLQERRGCLEKTHQDVGDESRSLSQSPLFPPLLRTTMSPSITISLPATAFTTEKGEADTGQLG